LRIKAVKLLGAVFAVGSYHNDFSQAFAEFKRRSVDKETDVRKALVNVMQALVTKRPEMGKILMEDEWNYMGGSREAPLLKLVIDPDEGVRKDAVSAVLSACLLNSDAVPHAIVEYVAERIMDKKPSVRKLAMEGLAMLWQKYCAPVDSSRLPRSVSDRFGWIPSKILMIQSAEARPIVLHCIEDICLEPLNDERSIAEVALGFFSDLDAKAKDNLITLLKLRGRFCEHFVKFCHLREQVATDMDLEDGEKSEEKMLQKASQFFSDPASAYDHLQKLHAMKAQVGIKIWQLLEKLVKTPVDHADTLKIQDEVLKRLGPKHPQLSFAKTLIAKLSDRCFGVDFIRLVFNAAVDDSNLGTDAKKCLTLIPQIAIFNKNLVLGEEKSLEALLTSRCDDAAVCQSVLRTIAVAGEQMPGLRKIKTCIATVKDLCMHDSWEVAKYAVRSLVALGCDDQSTLSKLSQKAAVHVSFGNKLPSALRVLTEVARVCPEAVEKDRETVSKFVRRRLLQGSWPASAGKKERNVVIDSKVQGLKLLTVFSFHDDEGNSKAALELLQEIISNGGEILSGDSSTPKSDKVTLRKTAGSCVLKIAKQSRVQSLVSPSVFSTLSRLLEDEERIVKETMLNKLFKGTAVEHGKLPFRFASLFAFVVHDTDSGVAERGKTQLRNTLMIMSKLKKQTGSEVINIMCEHIIPWLIYLLVVHHEYADPDEDATQSSLAYKKYFELFFACVPHEEHNSSSVQQILHFIRKCSVPAAAAAHTSAKVIERNIGLATEVAERILLNKRWSSKAFLTTALPKVVDASIFCESGKIRVGDELAAFAFSPAKAAGAASKASNTKTGNQRVASAASVLGSPPKSRKRKIESAEADCMLIDDEQADFDFDHEPETGNPKGKSRGGEQEEGRTRRPPSVGAAPSKVLAPRVAVYDDALLDAICAPACRRNCCKCWF
jgi:sister-chromatid-cohesion protein PDS5